MQSAAWKAIFNRVPREHHEIMMVVTSIGIEINVKTIQLLEPDYVVIRGRLGGTTDAGRVFFVPYDQINYITFNKEIREEHVADMLGLERPPPKAPMQEGDAVRAAQEPAVEDKKDEPGRPAADLRSLRLNQAKWPFSNGSVRASDQNRKAKGLALRPTNKCPRRGATPGVRLL